MVDNVLRMRATINTTEGLAAIRAWGREVGYLPGKIKPGLKDAETAFGRLGKVIQETGKQITAVVPALSGFGIGAAGGVIAAGALLRTFTDMAKRIVELREASKELGMSERDIRAWGLAAEKVGISSQSMQQGLMAFKKTTDGLKYNIGGVRDELYALGAGPIVQRMQAATTQADKLKVAFDFKEQLMKADPSGFKARSFFDQIGLGADKARLSYEEFARSQAKIKPFSKEDEEAAKKFSDSLKELSETWDHLVTKAGVKLFPALAETIKDVDDLIGGIDRLSGAIGKLLPTGSIKGAAIEGMKQVPGLQGAGYFLEWLENYHKSRAEQEKAAGEQEKAAGTETPDARQRGIEELQRKLRAMAPKYQKPGGGAVRFMGGGAMDDFMPGCATLDQHRRPTR